MSFHSQSSLLAQSQHHHSSSSSAAATSSHEYPYELWPKNHAQHIAALWSNTSLQQQAQPLSPPLSLSHVHNEDDDTLSLFLPLHFIISHVISMIFIMFLFVSILYTILLLVFPTLLHWLQLPQPNEGVQQQQQPVVENTNHHYSKENHQSTTSLSTTSTNPQPEHHNATTTTTTNPMTTKHPATALIFTKTQQRKLCYQITNCCINFGFGCLGLYYEYYYSNDYHDEHQKNHNNYNPTASQQQHSTIQIPTVLSAESASAQQYYSLEQTVAGYNHVIYLSAGQIGYQLWAILVGIYIVPEPFSMLLHHCTVIVCASMSGFLTYGFRYWTPFFYGIVEWSSVPLAIMNAFKDHPHTLQRYYPRAYVATRYIFAISFLYIRICMFIPRKYCFLRDQILLWTSIHHVQHRSTTNTTTSASTSSSSFNDNTIVLYQCYMSIVSISALFLLILQSYWAILILKGLFHPFFRHRSSTSRNTTSNANGSRLHDEQGTETTEKYTSNNNNNKSKNRTDCATTTITNGTTNGTETTNGSGGCTQKKYD
jgi:hypothetical protein